MLDLLSGEITTTSNIKHSTVLVPKNTCRALTSNYSLHSTQLFKNEEAQTGGSLTCFNRRLHEIQLKSTKMYQETSELVSAKILLSSYK